MTMRSKWILLVLMAVAASAAGQVVGGTITGDVTDSSGAVVTRADVDVRNEDTGTERVLTTGDSGSFSAPSVPVGAYTVTVTAEGFAPYRRQHVALTVGEQVSVPVVLAAGTTQTAEVLETPLSPVNVSTEQTA